MSTNSGPTRFAAVHSVSPLRRLATVAGLALLTGAVGACARTSAQPADPPPPKVTVAEVLSRQVTEWDEFTGRIEAVNTVAIRPRVSGFVSAVRFEEGAVVRAGDLLFQIDPRPFQAEVDRLRAELVRARATVQRAGSELSRAQRLAVENAMSHEEQERRAAFAQESAAQVSAVEAALRAAELNLEFTRVTSPIAGRVGRAIVTQGNLVSSGPGEATLLTTVVSLDPIYASFDADEQTLLRYQSLAREGKRASARENGLPIRLALASDADFPREGKMNFLDNQLDPATGTIRGRAVFRNTDRGLTPGLFVRLRLPGSGAYQGVLIQDRAVGTDLDKRFVLVVNGEHVVQYRPVTLGPLVDGLRVVRSGLQPRDLVVINGLQRVRPGAKVDIETVAMDAPLEGEAAPQTASAEPAKEPDAPKAGAAKREPAAASAEPAKDGK
jgi:RND family efflux transporter MFP subunit